MPLVAKDEGFVYFQVAFVRGLSIVGAILSTRFGSNLLQKRYWRERGSCFKKNRFCWKTVWKRTDFQGTLSDLGQVRLEPKWSRQGRREKIRAFDHLKSPSLSVQLFMSETKKDGEDWGTPYGHSLPSFKRCKHTGNASSSYLLLLQTRMVLLDIFKHFFPWEIKRVLLTKYNYLRPWI